MFCNPPSPSHDSGAVLFEICRSMPIGAFLLRADMHSIGTIEYTQLNLTEPVRDEFTKCLAEFGVSGVT